MVVTEKVLVNTCDLWSNAKFLCFYYDVWIDCKVYRSDFLRKLGLTDDIAPGITAHGGGSSFSGHSRVPTVDEAMERYKKMPPSQNACNIVIANARIVRFLEEDEIAYLQQKGYVVTKNQNISL